MCCILSSAPSACPLFPYSAQVGRLGPEKNLFFLKDIMQRLPDDVCLAVVGDGPVKSDLEEHLKDTNTVFTGALTGSCTAMLRPRAAESARMMTGCGAG